MLQQQISSLELLAQQASAPQPSPAPSEELVKALQLEARLAAEQRELDTAKSKLEARAADVEESSVQVAAARSELAKEREALEKAEAELATKQRSVTEQATSGRVVRNRCRRLG